MKFLKPSSLAGLLAVALIAAMTFALSPLSMESAWGQTFEMRPPSGGNSQTGPGLSTPGGPPATGGPTSGPTGPICFSAYKNFQCNQNNTSTVKCSGYALPFKPGDCGAMTYPSGTYICRCSCAENHVVANGQCVPKQPMTAANTPTSPPNNILGIGGFNFPSTPTNTAGGAGGSGGSKLDRNGPPPGYTDPGYDGQMYQDANGNIVSADEAWNSYDASQPAQGTPGVAAANDPASQSMSYEDTMAGGAGGGDSGRSPQQWNKEDYLDGSDCQYSKALDMKSCKTTRGIAKGAQVVDMVGQIGGSLAVSIEGQRQASKASNAGSQEASLRGAAAAAQMAGTKDVSLGAVNTAAGIAQFWRASGHSGEAETAKDTARQAQNLLTGRFTNTGQDSGQDSATDGYVRAKDGDAAGETIAEQQQRRAEARSRGDDDAMRSAYEGGLEKGAATADLAGRAIDNFELNRKYRLQAVRGVCAAGDTACEAQRTREIQARTQNWKNKTSGITSDVKNVTRRAAKEQEEVAEEANIGGFMSTIKGITQLAGGILALNTAKQLEKAANNLKNAEGTRNDPNFKSDPLAPDDASAPKTGVNVNTGAASASVEDESTEEVDDAGDLGTGFNPDPNDDLLAGAPAPGAFDPGAGGGAGGTSGSIPGLGGGGTGADNSGAGEANQQAAYADMGGGDASYFEGGSRRPAGGGGSGNKGIDLSSLLGQLLGQKPEEAGPKNGILAFGARGPGGMDGSMLGPQENIFRRISETYQEKNRKGAVGLK